MGNPIGKSHERIPQGNPIGEFHEGIPCDVTRWSSTVNSYTAFTSNSPDPSIAVFDAGVVVKDELDIVDVIVVVTDAVFVVVIVDVGVAAALYNY